jgi:hypothetical protein
MEIEFNTFQDDYLGIKLKYPAFLVLENKTTGYYQPHFVVSLDKSDIPFFMQFYVSVTSWDKNLSLEQLWDKNCNYEMISKSKVYGSGYITISGTEGKFIVYGIPTVTMIDVLTVKDDKIYQLAFEIRPIIANQPMNEVMKIVDEIIKSFTII